MTDILPVCHHPRMRGKFVAPADPDIQAIVAAVVASLDPSDRALGLKPEYAKRHRGGCDPTTGFCSVATEAVWALLGGNSSGYVKMFIRHEGFPHWFLLGPQGPIDPTASQFLTSVPYTSASAVRKGTPVTRKTGTLYLGDSSILISRKAARLIELSKRRLGSV